MPNVVLVHTQKLQARQDFEDIAVRIEAIDPGVRAFVATNGENNDAINEAIATAPTIVFSPVSIDAFRPARGRVYQGMFVDKIEQYRRLVAHGIPTPRTKVLEKGDVFPESQWSKYVVLKPLSPSLQSGGKRTYRIAAAKLTRDLNIHGMFAQYDMPGGALVQTYINTGPELEYRRILTFFGEILYAMGNRLISGLDLDRSPFPTGAISVATQAYAGQKEAMMIGDDRYLDLARRCYPAFPDRALQAVDVVRCHDTDRLFVLELNLGGNTWHFSSEMINERVTDTRKRQDFRKKKMEQFGAFDVAAKALARMARTEGL